MTPGTGGVIHDIGYRHHDGPRERSTRTALHLFVTGLRHAYGLGRSGRSKVLPLLLAFLTLAPAMVMVAMTGVMGLDEPPLTYADYTNQTYTLVSLFVAAQAPVLFSRDLRSRSIVLYLARPLGSAAFALVRWASLAVATLLFVVVPTTLLWLGALLAGADAGEQTGAWLRSLPLAVLLSVLLAGITGLVASVALRRGFAVVGSILVLIVLTTVIIAVQEIAAEEGSPGVGVLAGVLSPWTLFRGLADSADAGLSVATPPDGAGDVALHLVVAGLVLAATLLGLVRRFAKAGR